MRRRSTARPTARPWARPLALCFSIMGLTNLFPKNRAVTTANPTPTPVVHSLYEHLPDRIAQDPGGDSSKGVPVAWASNRRRFHSVQRRRSSDRPSALPSDLCFSIMGLTNLFPKNRAVTTANPTPTPVVHSLYEHLPDRIAQDAGGGSSKGVPVAWASNRRRFHSVQRRRSSDRPSARPSALCFSIMGLRTCFPRIAR